MLQDVKDKKINVIVAFKLDRITGSVYDIEKLMTIVNEYECDIDCMADESNTTTLNGRMVMRIMTSVSQNEIILKKHIETINYEMLIGNLLVQEKGIEYKDYLITNYVSNIAVFFQ